MVNINITVGQKPTKKHIAAQAVMKKRAFRSKRIQKLEKAAHKIPYGGNWGFSVSLLHPGQIALTGDGIPVVYLKPLRGLFWYEITDTQTPFSKLLKEGQTVSLPDIIRVLDYVGRNAIK